MKECGRRYFDAALQFCDLVKEKNNGVFPTDLMSLTDDVVRDIVFGAICRENNFDLLVLIFLKFSRFECFYEFNDFVNSVFMSNDSSDNLFFLFSLLRHMNSIFYDEIAAMEKMFIFGEEEVFNDKMSCKNKISLLNILQSDFTNIFDSSLLNIRSMPELEKKEIARYLQYLVFENGFVGVLFLYFLNARSFFLLGLDIDAICNDLPRPQMLDKSPHIVDDTFSDKSCKNKKVKTRR